MGYRRTLRREVACTGIGLHSGRAVHLRLRPAPAEHGIRFLRADVGVEIPATLQYLGGQDHATTLTRDGVSIGTIEHLLAALGGLGIDDVLVEVDGPEVPVLDGSAAPFVMLLHEAGLRPLAVPRLHVKVLEPVEVVRGAKSVRLLPADHFEVAYSIGFDHPLLRHQSFALRVTPRAFTDAISSARTFGFLRDVEMLRKSGLALGGSLENAVVIGETGVLNNKLRFADEFVRHKILDAVGDLTLLAHPLVGRLEATRAGHALHAEVAQKLLSIPTAWELVPRPGIPTLEAVARAPEPRLQPAEA
ncbi:MAG: UDP-3-O-acyl-N-acetylglucosamine deacetylase [Acidobacteria bacterium]|jgi:UDP-3-O-[3-hydroxymyristoyl] N-acetylglucosamine deacetylase|nr:UDP-3-O-acyl-N-acetylglucosamine deacetylase [Acidobacteriota bacterium]